MSPFHEATYEQLARLLKILDKQQCGVDTLLRWANGETAQENFTTEYTLQYWEHH